MQTTLVIPKPFYHWEPGGTGLNGHKLFLWALLISFSPKAFVWVGLEVVSTLYLKLWKQVKNTKQQQKLWHRKETQD
jgi:hypothetical protein